MKLIRRTKKLLLLRHGLPASGKITGDHDRSLRVEGKVHSSAMGIWLNKNGLLPDQILSSTAQRSKQTLECLGNERHNSHIVRPLYNAEISSIFRVLREVGEGNCVLVVCDQPFSITAFQKAFSNYSDFPNLKSQPCCSLLIVDCAIEHWSQIERENAKISAFLKPTDVIQPSPEEIGSMIVSAQLVPAI